MSSWTIQTREFISTNMMSLEKVDGLVVAVVGVVGVQWGTSDFPASPAQTLSPGSPQLSSSLHRQLLPPVCRSTNEVDNGTNLSSLLICFG